MADTFKTEAEVVADLARKQMRGVEVIKVQGPEGMIEVIVKPEAGGACSLISTKPFTDPYLEAPERRIGTARLVDLDSFVWLVNRHKDEDSVLFLRTEPPQMGAVFDYHRKDGSARFGQHRALYEFPLSDEWEAWTAQNGKPLAQEDWAAWIEDHILDLMDPVNCGEGAKAFAAKLSVPLATPAKLVELSRGLSVYAGFQCTRMVNLQTGEAQMTFNEEHKDATGAPLTIPGAFVIAIPVFKNGDRFQLPVRLRYRLVTGSRQVVWSFELYQPEKVLATALDDAARVATEETNLPLYRGSPEI